MKLMSGHHSWALNHSWWICMDTFQDDMIIASVATIKSQMPSLCAWRGSQGESCFLQQTILQYLSYLTGLIQFKRIV